MKSYNAGLVSVACLTVCVSALCGAEPSAPQHLRCEFLADPLGIDCATPRLSWWLNDGHRGAAQTAYRIMVASSRTLLEQDRTDLWDSGEVKSDRSHLVAYAGRALPSHQECFWKVKTWDQDGKPSPWSEAGKWTMGILQTGDWSAAKWIRMAGDVEAPPGAMAEGKGYHSQDAAVADTVKWVQIDLQTPRSIGKIELHPASDAGIKGLCFPVRYRIDFLNAAGGSGKSVFTVDRTADDQVATDAVVAMAVEPAVKARYIRLTATRLRDYKGKFSLRLRRLAAFEGTENVAIGAAVSAIDSVRIAGWDPRTLTAFPGAVEQADVRSHLPIFRREFNVAKPVARATLYLCGLGHQEPLLDGQRIGDRWLDPPWTQYNKTCGYTAYELPALPQGPHVLGVMLGNGFFHITGGRYIKIRQSFGQPQLIALLRLQYGDGTVEQIGSDTSWQCIRGPVVFSCVYGGEDHDLRREPTGWASPGFDASKWQAAVESQGSGGKLRWICQEPVRATEKFQPRKMTQDARGVVIDFGQNCALMPTVRLKGPAGATVRIGVGEGAGGGGMKYQCTLAGRGEEVFRPRFMSWGSRSLTIEGATLDGAGGAVQALGAEGWALRCGAEAVGAFECSDETVNAVDRIIFWSVHSNFQHVLTDCPHREKLGWLEVSHLMAPSILFRFGAANFYRKIQDDMSDVQQDDGMVPTVAPFAPFGRGAFGDSPEWGSAFIINPGLSWQWTGDRTPLEASYNRMKQFVAYLHGRAKDGLLAYGLGDWMPIERTPMPIVATATLYHDLDLMSTYARILGKSADADMYADQAVGIAKAFHDRFWKDDATGYGAGSQCAQAMPLFFGMVSEAHKPAALARLIADAKAKGRATGGDVGNRYILMALAQAGQNELVFRSTVTGNGAYMPQAQQTLKGDRTTLAEGWGGGASQNHCMLGHVQEWLYGYLAGIRPDPDSPGLRRLLLEPNPVGEITWVKAHHDGPYGRIAIHWRRQAGALEVDCTIPPNSSARLRLPTSDPASVRESEGAPAAALQAAPVSGGVQFRLPAGTYRFRCAFPAVGQPHVQATP